MAITHVTVAANPQSPRLDNTAWNAAHVGSNLTVKDEGTPLDTAVTSVDFTGAGVTATTVGHAVTVAIPGGGSTPTLAAVLAAGNDPDGIAIQGAPSIDSFGAELQTNAAGVGTGGDGSLSGGDTPLGFGASAYVGGGNGTASLSGGGNADNSADGGDAYIIGGRSAAAQAAYFYAQGGRSTGDAGKAGISSDNSTGAAGQLFEADGAGNGLWASLYSQGAGAPGGTLTTLLYGDTTAVTGGLYVWNVSAYRKVTGVLP